MKESAGATMLKRVEREQAMKGVVPLGSFLTKVRPRAHCLLRSYPAARTAHDVLVLPSPGACPPYRAG